MARRNGCMGRVTLSSTSISGSGELGRTFCLLPRDKIESPTPGFPDYRPELIDGQIAKDKGNGAQGRHQPIRARHHSH
jgi:hypothetical protein